MKKVRFETAEKAKILEMNDSECHSPRPFIEREVRTHPPEYNYPRLLPYQCDPLQRYEISNSSPYPLVNRTQIPSFSDKELCWRPSDDLNLSLLDASGHEPRQPVFCKSILKETDENKMRSVLTNVSEGRQRPVLSSIENNKINDPPNILVKDNSFFIRRENLDKYHFNVNPLQNQLNRLVLDKENDPLARKAEMMTAGNANMPVNNPSLMTSSMSPSPIIDYRICRCHHCNKAVENVPQPLPPAIIEKPVKNQVRHTEHHCACSTPRNAICSNCAYIPPPVQQNICKLCNCHIHQELSLKPQNAVDLKTQAIEKYEKSKSDCMDVEKQTNITKEKREPTVADLFKIIKLQNEQLQLLQEKVDKFMSLGCQNAQPTITCSSEHVAVNTVQNDQHKMSIGVMTSFEMIRTSTVINKEVLKQTNDNAEIQCNRSQISIKEVVSNPGHLNFLDGIAHKNVPQPKCQSENNVVANGQQTENNCDDKTLNELSLYNVQVNNATTPLMSPEQTMYLDVRDYSDSEASSNNQSNVGWTYYNKVMTHVNGMLQDSEMPSSASAMYRNMRQQCVQMQIDKTNVSVTKRVKFGDDPLGFRQPHMYGGPATDTSLKMNQLAAKYLKNMPIEAPTHQVVPNPTAAHVDMSFATRNYMEKHRLLQGLPSTSKSPRPGEIPRFLDITALKQQPKFL